MDEFENKVLDIISKLYEREYIGKLHISRIKPFGFKLTLGMNNVDKPIVIAAQLNEEDFLKYVYNELRERNFVAAVHYSMGEQILPYSDCKIPACDEGRCTN